MTVIKNFPYRFNRDPITELCSCGIRKTSPCQRLHSTASIFSLQARTSSVLVLLLYRKHLFRSMFSAKKVFVFCEFFLKDFIWKHDCGRTASTADVYPLALLLALLGRIASTADVRTLCENERFGLTTLALILLVGSAQTPLKTFINQM